MCKFVSVVCDAECKHGTSSFHTGLPLVVVSSCVTPASFFLAIIRDYPNAYHVHVVALTHLERLTKPTLVATPLCRRGAKRPAGQVGAATERRGYNMRGKFC